MIPIRNSPGSALLLALVLAACLPVAAWGHTKLDESTPAADALINETPEELVLNYAGEVNLVKVALIDPQGDPVDTNFKPGTQASTRFAIPLPTLSDGQYTVKWTALGADGHILEGSFGFTLDSDGS
ncbi:MAG: copper resistance CopC family protein [Cellvibrionaceae bacterium]